MTQAADATDNAVDIFAIRAISEEGIRLTPYDDATGARVKAPKGRLTWGIGFNLDEIGSAGLFSAMLRYLANVIHEDLLEHDWYRLSDPVRQSVFLDVAYNEGVTGLLRFPHMIAAASVGDWERAAAECHVADPRLDASRYAPLRKLLSAGENSLAGQTVPLEPF